ncbi:MAG: InlB B-repeat-containing protein [Paludibacteraceae bacterium]|nr:InlB B-repeat-containing protein [Paludibacteraceae bacterium]
MRYNLTRHIIILLLLLACVLPAHALNTIYLLNSKYGWIQNSNSPSFNNALGIGECCTFLQSESSFAISINGQQYGPTTNGLGLNAGDAGFNMGTTGHNAAKYIGPDGIVIIHSDQTGENSNTSPWIWITRPTIQFKYPWTGTSEWSYVNSTDNYDGTYSYNGTYYGIDGFNWAINNTEKKYLRNDSLEIEDGLISEMPAVFIYNSKEDKGYILKRTRTITVDANEGVCGTSTINVQYGNTMPPLPTATRSGYTFVGWFTAPEGGTQVTEATVVRSDFTIYAHWNKVEITNINITRNARPSNPINATPTVSGLVSGNLYTFCWEVYDQNNQLMPDVNDFAPDGTSVSFTAPNAAGSYKLRLTIHDGETCSDPLLAEKEMPFTILGEEVVIYMRCDPATYWTHDNYIYYFKGETQHNAEWPGEQMTYLGLDSADYPWYTRTIDNFSTYNGGSMVFNNGGIDVKQTVDIPIPDDITLAYYEVLVQTNNERKRNCTTRAGIDMTPRILLQSDTVNQYQGVTFTIAAKALFLPSESIRYTYSARIKNGAKVDLDDSHSFIPTRENADRVYVISITATNEDSISVANDFEIKFLRNPIELTASGQNAIGQTINLTTSTTTSYDLSGKYFTYTVLEPNTTGFITIDQNTTSSTNNRYTALSTGRYKFQVIISNNADGTDLFGKAETIWEISPMSYYIKHPFINTDVKPSGNDWVWKEMRYNGDGTYSYFESGISFFHTGTGNDTIGANIHTSIHDGNKGYVREAAIKNPNGITDNTEAIFVYSVQNNELSVYPATTDQFRIKSICEDGTYYSNTISTPTQQLSFFAEKAGLLTWQKWNKKTEEWMDTTTITSKIPDDGVYIAEINELSSKTFDTLYSYNGDFTLYGEVSNYGLEKDDTSAVFTRFIPNKNYENEYFNHYWIEFIHKGRNVLASVGNSINHNLAGILPYYKLPQGANVRYSYDNTTNLFQRTFLAGSSYNKDEDGIEGDNPNYLRVSIDGVTPAINQRVNDGSDWVYSIKLTITKGDNPVKAKLVANYNNFNRWILAEDGTEYSHSASKTILGKTTTKDKTYKIELIYDYKTNRLTAGWIPNNDTIRQPTFIDADMLIVRNGNTDDQENINYVYTGDNQVLDLDAIITLFDIDRKNIADSTLIEVTEKGKKYNYFWKDNNKHYYWLSLPYDCAISDIYGLEDYGTKWYMEEYRGDIRAALGWLYEIPSFWSQMYLTDTLRANQGYVLYFNPDLNKDFEAVGSTSRITLYFPSQRGTYTISKNTFEQTIESHKCTIEKPIDRRAIDSNWNVIGIPSYTTTTISSSTGRSSKWDGQSQTTYNGLKYFYKWNGRGNGDTYTAYDIDNGDGGTRFQPTFAYLVQYAGTITWDTKAFLSLNNVASRERINNMPNKYCLQLLDSTSQLRDQAFVVLDSLSSDEYELGNDLQKILSATTPQIYTIAADNPLAANQLADTTSRVPLVLSLPDTTSYSIHLREAGQTLSPILFDALTGTYTNLAETDYTFCGTAGQDEERFTLFFGQIPEQSTAITATSATTLHACIADGQIIISSDEPLSGTIRLYDAAGRLISAGAASSASAHLPAPTASGIYLIQAGNAATRILIP